jgi:UDP-glucose 4-epimerase
MVDAYAREHRLPTSILRFGSIRACDEIMHMWSARRVLELLRDQASRPGYKAYVEGAEESWGALEEMAQKDVQLVIPRDLNGRSWLHHPGDVRDFVAGTMLALEKPEAIGETFNILGPCGVTYEAAVKYISEETGQPYREVTLPNWWGWEGDQTKARMRLGYRPRYDLYRMVDSAIEYQRGVDIGVMPARI